MQMNRHTNVYSALEGQPHLCQVHFRQMALAKSSWVKVDLPNPLGSVLRGEAHCGIGGAIMPVKLVRVQLRGWKVWDGRKMGGVGGWEWVGGLGLGLLDPSPPGGVGTPWGACGVA